MTMPSFEAAHESLPVSLPIPPAMSRRRLLATTGLGFGGIALADLLGRRAAAGVPEAPHGALDAFHLPPKAKRLDMKSKSPPASKWPLAAKALAKPEVGLLKMETNSSKSSTPFPSASTSSSSA